MQARWNINGYMLQILSIAIIPAEKPSNDPLSILPPLLGIIKALSANAHNGLENFLKDNLIT
jgi:hypothetical protein